MTHLPNSWLVQVQGNGRELDHLAQHLVKLPRVFHKEEAPTGYLYESDAFAPCTTADEVLEAANRDLAILSGALSLTQGSTEPLQAGGVYRLNAAGDRDVFLHVQDAVHAHVAEEALLSVTDASGKTSIALSPPPRSVVLANLGFTDEAVAKALRLCIRADAKSWVGLYRLYEVIEADVGGQAVVIKRGWSTTSTLKRFKHCANSVAVAGDSSRHGDEPGIPPKQPMSIAEATAYIAYIMEAWLAHKAANAA